LMVAASAAVVTNTRRHTLQRFALLASLGAASRLLVTAVPTMLGSANDERWIGSVTGLSARAIWGAEIIVTGWLVALSALCPTLNPQTDCTTECERCDPTQNDAGQTGNDR
jgi:hypothetical protein